MSLAPVSDELASEWAASALGCRSRLDALCAQPVNHDAKRRLLKHLTHQVDALFPFLAVEGVDATNFRAEQAVRRWVVCWLSGPRGFVSAWQQPRLARGGHLQHHRQHHRHRGQTSCRRPRLTGRPRWPSTWPTRPKLSPSP